MKQKRLSLFSTVAALVIVTLCACAGKQTTSTKPDEAFAFLDHPIPPGQTLSGNYLAGRFAQRAQDWDAAQTYMGAVVGMDQANPSIMQRAFLLAVGAGQYDNARKLAEKVLAAQPDSEIALIYLSCDALQRDDFKGALALLEKLPADGFGDYTKPLLTAWAQMGLGDRDAAMKILRDKSDDSDPTFNLHAGLMAELAGDRNAAAGHYKMAMANGLTLHAALLIGNFFEREGVPEVAHKIYDGLGKLYAANPFSGLDNAEGKKHPANITRAADGAAFAIFDIATLLYERRAFDSAQIYGSVVQLLMPSSPYSHLMMGDIAAMNKQYGKAIQSYDAIAQDSPLYWMSRLRVAEVYEMNDRSDMAESLLAKLAARKETRVQAYVALGDIYRRQENFEKAIAAYDEALVGVPDLTEEHWPVIYARGMALERLNNWERAEKDLLMALQFQPDNPMILNFIGYSWADKGMNLDKALDYIKRAVALRPQDGYILDSYGWALYRTGDYDASIEWLEKAVALVPEDSTILDHLGDAYWRAGRKAEAQFKWNRARDISRDTAFRSLIEAKLKGGLQGMPEVKPMHKEANL